VAGFTSARQVCHKSGKITLCNRYRPSTAFFSRTGLRHALHAPRFPIGRRSATISGNASGRGIHPRWMKIGENAREG
jgi:hypothetical protein